MRLVFPAFEMISLPDLADQFNGGLHKEIEAELTAQKRLLMCFATYILALHSDIAQQRRLASLTALGMTKDEVLGTQFLLDAQDFQLMKDTVAYRKERAVLAGVAGQRKPPIKKKPWKRNNRNGRGRGGGQGEERGKQDKGDDDGSRDDANKGSKDSSSKKSTSTPGKPYKGKPRGKNK